MIGQTLAYYGSSLICLVIFYLLFSFLTVIGGLTEASGYFLLRSCINSEIVYKRPLVSPLVTVL